jgi:hypothetical protein
MKASKQILGILALVASAATLPARADGHSGDSLKDMSEQWWQWALSIPTPNNPLTDTTGANCMVGQRGPVWFLAGAFAGGVARRTCSVPEGVALFFPISNYIAFDTPGICGQGASLSLRELRDTAKSAIDAVTVATAKLDNKPVKNVRRVRSEPFVTVLPTNNVFVELCAGDAPPGVFSPSVDEGYYVKLDGLDPGVHTLTFRAKAGASEQDIEYILNVIPVSRAVKN